MPPFLIIERLKIQFPRGTGNYIKDLGRQGRLAQKQRPKKRRKKHKKHATKNTHQKKNKKNAKQTHKKKRKATHKKKCKKNATNSRFSLIFQICVFFKGWFEEVPFFFSFFSCYVFVFFSWSFFPFALGSCFLPISFVFIFPFCVGVLFGPEDPKSNVSYSVFLQECFADMLSRNIEKPGLEKCGNTSDKAWQPEENKRRNKKQHPQTVKKKRKNSRKKKHKRKTRKKHENRTRKKHENGT